MLYDGAGGVAGEDIQPLACLRAFEDSQCAIRCIIGRETREQGRESLCDPPWIHSFFFPHVQRP